MKRHWRSIVTVLGVTVGLAVVPLRIWVVQAEGVDLAVTANDACATGTCCFQPGSLCPLGTGDFFSHRYYETVCPNT